MTAERRKRHLKILELISTRAIHTQEELADALAAEGWDVTQSSVSRDIATLRLIKSGGAYRRPTAVSVPVDPDERRIAEGAAMIRTKGEAGTGDVVHAVKHLRQIIREMKQLTVLSEEELYAQAKELKASYELVRMVAETGKLPVPNFSAGGIATPADAALVRQLGAEAVFVGSGIFMADSINFCEPAEAEKRARAIVRATTHFDDPKVLLEVSEDLTGAMKGLAVAAMTEADMLQTRGW